MLEILNGEMQEDQNELELDISTLPDTQCRELDNYVKQKLALISAVNKEVIKL